MRYRYFAIPMLVLSFLFTSCGKGRMGTPPSKLIFVLVDFSGSAKNSREAYLNSFRKIFGKEGNRKIYPGDRIIVWKISEKSLMEQNPLVDESFDVSGNFSNEFYRKQAFAKVRKDIEIRLPLVMSKMENYLFGKGSLQGAPLTDILGSLNVAERVFRSAGKSKNILVIMSDMIEDSREYHLGRISLTDKRIGTIISREKELGRIPDLKGVKVYVAGANAPTREKYFEIQKFWMRYFKECGADLREENYGSTIVTFNE